MELLPDFTEEGIYKVTDKFNKVLMLPLKGKIFIEAFVDNLEIYKS